MITPRKFFKNKTDTTCEICGQNISITQAILYGTCDIHQNFCKYAHPDISPEELNDFLQVQVETLEAKLEKAIGCLKSIAKEKCNGSECNGDNCGQIDTCAEMAHECLDELNKEGDDAKSKR